jgi:hypothetical protein
MKDVVKPALRIDVFVEAETGVKVEVYTGVVSGERRKEEKYLYLKQSTKRVFK